MLRRKFFQISIGLNFQTQDLHLLLDSGAIQNPPDEPKHPLIPESKSEFIETLMSTTAAELHHAHDPHASVSL